MKAQELLAGLRVRPIRDRRNRYTPPGVQVLNETWAAAAVCCEPDCGWHVHQLVAKADPAISARNHADLHRHQTLVAWYAADRYMPDLNAPTRASPRPGTVPPRPSDYQGQPEARPEPTNSRKTSTTSRSTK